MESGAVIDLVYQALRMAAMLAGPMLMALLVVGLVIGILQAATQVNESTVSFVPKLAVLAVVLLVAFPVSLAIFIDYVREIITRIPSILN